VGNAQQTLSYVVSADDKASAVFRGVGAEITKLANLGNTGLSGLSKNMNSLSSHKPLEFVKAQQAVEIARTEEQMAKLTKATTASGAATKLQAAEMGVLTQQHKSLQREMALTEGSHVRLRKATDMAAAGILGVGTTFVVMSVKAAVAFDKLERSVAASTGLSGKSLQSFMGTVREVARTTEFSLEETAAAAQILRKRFNETGPVLGQSTKDMLFFAKATGQEAKSAIDTLANAMIAYRVPGTEVNKVMDEFLAVAQKTQQPASELESTLQRFGPALQAMGFGFQSSLALFGAFQEAGISTGMVSRGLMRAVQTASKEIGVVTSQGVGQAGHVLGEYKMRLDATKARLAALESQSPKTAAAQATHNATLLAAKAAVVTATEKYETLNTTLSKAGGVHATVAKVIQSEFKAMEEARNPAERMNEAIAIFGGRAGPAFARALDQGKVSLSSMESVLKTSTGTVETAGKKMEEGPAAQWAIFKKEVHDLEIGLGTGLLPVLNETLHVFEAMLSPVEELIKDHKQLADILGGGLMGGAALTLASRHTPLGGLTSKIPGPVGSFLSPTGSGSWGVTGPIRPGSLTNPVMVRMEGGKGGSSIPGVGGASSAAERDAAVAAGASGGSRVLSLLKSGGKMAGAVGLAFEVGNEIVPGNRTTMGLPTGQNSLTGQFHNQVEDLNKSISDLFKLKVGGATKDFANFLGFGEGANDHVRAFGDEITKLQPHLQELSQGELTKIHDEAVKMADDPQFSKWKPQLEGVAKAFNPVRIGLENVQVWLDTTRKASHEKLGDIVLIAQNDAGQINRALGGTRAGTDALGQNFQIAEGIIQQKMREGTISTAQGVSAIAKLLASALSMMGVKGGPTAKDLEPIISAGDAGSYLKYAETGESGPKEGGHGGLKLATGGRVPGGVGPDNWTLIDPSGRPAARVGGGEILIGNRHTEARVDQMLAPYGTSLGREVAGEHTPHSAATGLRIRGPVSTFGPPGEAAGGTAYGKSSSEAGIAVNPHGGGNWNDALAQSLAMKVARVSIGGHSANLRVIDKGPSAIGSHGPRLIDVTGAGVSALGMSYGSFPTDAIGEAVFGAGGTAVGGHGVFGSIKAPKWTGPGGTIGQIGRAVLHRVAAAANAKLASVHPSSGASGLGTAAGAAPTGGGFTPSQLGTFDGLTVADWIIPELSYARAHGWAGHITSGYRPGADPKAPGGSMHALDIYPGGAVDFGGEVDPAGLANREAFLAATAGYTGSKLLKPIGFRDDGHLSGTGHALGGRVGFAGSFGQGGTVTASSPTMALFGEKGTETAVFLPHASTGKRVYGNNPYTDKPEYHTSEEWHTMRVQHTYYAHTHPKAKKPLSPEKELEADIRESLGIAKARPGTDIAGVERVGTQTTGTLKKLLAEAHKLHSKALAVKLKGDIEGWAKHTGGMIEKLALENPTEAPAADKQAIAGLRKLMSSATAKGSKALTDTLIGDLLKVAQNWQKDIVSKLSKREAHLTVHENLKIVNESLAAIQSKGIGSTLPTAATDPSYLAAQKAAKEGEIVELTAEHKALKAAEVKAHHAHNKKLVAALRVQMGEVDDAITGAKVDVGNLQIEYQKAVYEAFKRGIAEVDAGLQAHVSKIQTGETLEEGSLHREGKDFSGLEEDKTKQEGVLTPAQIAQAKSDYAAYKTHHEEQIKVDEEQRQHDIESLPGLSGEDRTSMERTIEGLSLSINGLQTQIYDQGKSTEKLTEATKENTKVLGGSVGFTYQGQQYVAGASASQSSNSAADIAVGI